MIHMLLNTGKYSELNFIVGNEETINKMQTAPALPPFADNVVSFLNDLSKYIMSSGRNYSDVMTFGFWCRRSALQQEKNKYDDISSRLGRGIVFHSTPSNVPVNFAFSLAAGLLAGNANIVRIPAKQFEQVQIICQALNELLQDSHRDLASYICMVKYPPITGLTDMFSAICDSRVIWGGDTTIEEIRQSPLKPRANEITFADRYSIAIIQADEYLKADDKERIAQNFYNDTYFSDQNACTSPRIVIWTGDNIEKAKAEFWENIYLLAREKYMLAPTQSVGKLSAFYRVASQYDVRLEKSEDQLITRITVSKLDQGLMNYNYHSGFFFEYDMIEFNEILPVCDGRCQTIAYYGLDKKEIERLVLDLRPCGVDRIVPLGKSMDFSLVWDGYDLIKALSRKISVI